MMPTLLDNKMTTLHEKSEVLEFFCGKNVFVTGASGFVGTLLVEKILRSCKNIKTLFILLRAKNNSNLDVRVREYFNDEIFSRMKLENPNYFKQVKIINGDFVYKKFNMSSEDEQTILNETHIVFHVAATVRFDEHVRTAYHINVESTRTMLSMAEQMSNLKSFIHVSTAYCNSEIYHIEETVYKPPFSETELINLLNFTSDEDLSVLTNHILNNKANTYTLTKSIAETVVEQKFGILPVSIVRPSVIVQTLKEPIPLWFKGVNGLIALILGIGIGLLRVGLCNTKVHIDTVPGDKFVNALVGLAWYTANRSKEKKQYLFNYVCYKTNPITFKTIREICIKSLIMWKESSSSVIWRSHLYETKNIYCYQLLFYVFHLLPAFLFFSPAEKYYKKKPQILKLYRKIWWLNHTLKDFATSEWNFTDDNMEAFQNALSIKDKEFFDSDLKNFDWSEIYSFFPRSVSRYGVNDPFTKKNYRKRMYYIEIADNCINWILTLGFIYWFYCIFNMLVILAVAPIAVFIFNRYILYDQASMIAISDS